MFGPSSLLLLIFVLLAAVTALCLGVRALRRSHRILTIACAFLTTVCLLVAMGLQMNRTLGYARTWSDVPGILGLGTGGGSAKPLALPKVSPDTAQPIDAHSGDSAWDAAFEHNDVLETVFTGPKSGVTQPVRVWVPPTYSPTDGKTYRVMFILHGYPGAVKKIAAQMKLDERADLLGDTIVVMPSLQADQRSPDCIDLEGRPKVGTWVTEDVVGMIRHNFPNTSSDRKYWIMGGASSGGYCSMALGALYPQTFGSVVGFSPYDLPDTGLWVNSPRRIREQYSLSKLYAEQTQWPQRLFVTGTTVDPHSTEVVSLLSKLGNANLKVTTKVDEGGHNWDKWSDQFPEVIEWVTKE